MIKDFDFYNSVRSIVFAKQWKMVRNVSDNRKKKYRNVGSEREEKEPTNTDENKYKEKYEEILRKNRWDRE